MNLLLRLAARHEPLLAVPPSQLRLRLLILSQQALGLPMHDAAAALAAAPELLSWSAARLAAAAEAMRAVLSARGLQPSAILRARPDLLTQSAITVGAKLDALPSVLGLSSRVARQLVSRRPDLLRRSPEQLRARYQQLQSLLNIPPSFLGELLLAEPRVVCLSAPTLRAKFDALVDRCAGSGSTRARAPWWLRRLLTCETPVADGWRLGRLAGRRTPHIPLVNRLQALTLTLSHKKTGMAPFRTTLLTCCWSTRKC